MARFSKVTFLLAAVFTALPVFAHHSTVAIYDGSRRVEVTGVITSISWRNPHGRIMLDVLDENAKTVEWEAEVASSTVLRNRKVRDDVIKVGDRITIAGEPSRRGLPIMFGTNILLSSGYEFDFGSGKAHFPAGKSGNLVGYDLPDVDTSAAIAAADGIFRVWSTIMGDPAAFPIFKGGYPLNEAGKKALAAWDPNNNTLFQCGNKGQPLIMITPSPMDFTRQGEDILMRLEEYDSRRLIHMNPNAQAPSENSLFGFSRGHFEDDVFVVETDHIAAGYFDHMGAMQSDQISTVERFIPNADYTRLDYELTVTDPVYFSEPFTLKRYFVWYPEMYVHDYECLEQY
jgi:hypothetical protein